MSALFGWLEKWLMLMLIRCERKTLSLFAHWFQPAQTNQPTVFSSHKKPAPSNLNQHQPANRPTIISLKA